jgi:hypothetical protein
MTTSLSDLLRESVIVRGALAIIVVLGIMIMSIMNIEPDVRVWSLAFAVVGFFFGSASQGSVTMATKASQQQILDVIAQHNTLVQEIMAGAHVQMAKSIMTELEKRSPGQPP